MYDQSGVLREKHSQTTLEKPPVYYRRRSIQAFFRLGLPIILVAVALIVSLWIAMSFQWWYLLIAFVGWYFSYREFYKWRHNHIICDPEDGVVRIEDVAHPFVLFFITGSNNDQKKIDDLNLNTPTRTLLDLYIFHCAKVVTDTRTLTDVKDVDGLLAIQVYRDSLAPHSVALQATQADVQLALLETVESIGRALNESQSGTLQALAQLNGSFQEMFAWMKQQSDAAYQKGLVDGQLQVLSRLNPPQLPPQSS